MLLNFDDLVRWTMTGVAACVTGALPVLPVYQQRAKVQRARRLDQIEPAATARAPHSDSDLAALEPRDLPPHQRLLLRVHMTVRENLWPSLGVLLVCALAGVACSKLIAGSWLDAPCLLSWLFPGAGLLGVLYMRDLIWPSVTSRRELEAETQARLRKKADGGQLQGSLELSEDDGGPRGGLSVSAARGAISSIEEEES